MTKRPLTKNYILHSLHQRRSELLEKYRIRFYMGYDAGVDPNPGTIIYKESTGIEIWITKQ